MLVFFTDFSSQLCDTRWAAYQKAVLWVHTPATGPSPLSQQYLVLVVEGFKLRIHKQDVFWLQVCVGQLILM